MNARMGPSNRKLGPICSTNQARRTWVDRWPTGIAVSLPSTPVSGAATCRDARVGADGTGWPSRTATSLAVSSALPPTALTPS